MINSNELYYLNRALDGMEIYGVDPMENMINTLGSGKTARESLIEKNILTKEGKINEASYLLIEGLEKYKKAKKYLWVNSRIVALDDTNFVIHLEKEEEGKIVLKEITKAIMLYSIIKENSFLWGNKVVESKGKYVSVKEFISNILNGKNDEDILYIKIENPSRQEAYNIYYKEKDDIFKYDVIYKSLKKVNPKDIRIELVKLFDMNWGEKIG
ncbi:DUF5081 family protein [Clostridium sp. P21]|uniref:DUF5081 family protein n=1 Tax=Clostridium muellerianum TaxID=2716538 RepID=A0A7Y0HS39_9CLOT|nr:DUF5081 family protein [Clostridium muellerianum]NMM65851.1 DUF5081 family protein [Clostridium muellerianum]